MALKGFEIIDIYNPPTEKEIITADAAKKVGKLYITAADKMEKYEALVDESRYKEKARLKELRERAGLSDAQTAKLLGISKDGYYKIESGQTTPKLALALKMAKLFKVSVEKLFVVEESR